MFDYQWKNLHITLKKQKDDKKRFWKRLTADTIKNPNITEHQDLIDSTKNEDRYGPTKIKPKAIYLGSEDLGPEFGDNSDEFNEVMEKKIKYNR